MTSGHLDKFCRSSGLDPAVVTGLGDLDEASVGKLETLFAAARDNRARELGAAIDSGIGFLPRLMRIPVRKILFG